VYVAYVLHVCAVYYVYLIVILKFLCFHYPTVAANALCFQTVRLPRSSVHSSVRLDRSGYQWYLM